MVDDPQVCNTEVVIEFADGIGSPALSNTISIMNQSFAVTEENRFSASFVAEGVPTFVRGDCNFDLRVDIADGAAVISHLFLPGAWKFHPPCLDACDANDDGRIDLADVVTDLRYLFRFAAPPPNPGPVNRGPDPSEDKLDCDAGSACP